MTQETTPEDANRIRIEVRDLERQIIDAFCNRDGEFRGGDISQWIVKMQDEFGIITQADLETSLKEVVELQEKIDFLDEMDQDSTKEYDRMLRLLEEVICIPLSRHLAKNPECQDVFFPKDSKDSKDEEESG